MFRPSEDSVSESKVCRQPLALIQETVQALDMQSGLQFSLPSGYQARVAAATTLSQGNLGHTQPPASGHHPLSIQAHNTTQLGHPIQANSPMQFQRLKVEDALSYLDQVKYKFGNQPQVYNDFLDIMKEFKSQSIDTPGVIQRVSNLFRGHPELIVGFNTFLPPGYRIEVQPNEQVQVSIPGSTMGALTIHPQGPPTHSPTPKNSSHTPPVSNNNQPHSNSYNQNSPAPTQSSGGSRSPTPSQPVEFNHAINYVNKIKNRFQGQPDIYKQFLEILHTYQKEQRSQHGAAKPLTEAEVYSQVARLFQNQEDLLQEFGQFLPDANGAASALASLVSIMPLKPLSAEHNSVVKKPMPLKASPPINNQTKQTVKRPSVSAPSPPIKKPKMTSLKDVTLSEAGKCGSLNEYAFFDKVRKALKSQEVYDNFLRCLIIYNQELISRSDLVLVVTPFLQKHSDLLKWFKDFVGYKEMNNLDILPKKTETQERERVLGDLATEIDYSSCVKYGASYRAVPRNFVQPKCSGRTALCREVLNDTWVSFPSWSEDSTFVSSRKTQFEEYIYRCEDERFELDVVLESNVSTIRVLENEVQKMTHMSSEEKARYRLDDTLGGSSTVIQQRAIRRIYGDKANDIIEGLKKNPTSTVPIVLKRLRGKDEEWKNAQKSFNKMWREQNEKYYLKSLDHQGINFKQNDVKFLRSKSVLNEIETLYEERHEQAEEGGDVPSGPHLVVTYKSREVFKDAANLIIHHVKRQTGIHKEDKEKMKQLMRHFFPDFFSVPRGDLSEDEMDKDEDLETEDGNESPKSSVFRDLMTLNMACRRVQEALPSEDSYALMFGNNNWYIFFRLHHLLCERLCRLHEHSQALMREELRDQEERKKSTALALRLKPHNQLCVEKYYSAFLDMVKNLLDGHLESSQYEDSLRDMFGIHAYLGFTLDKLIQNLVRQLQHLVGEESCTQWSSLFEEEGRNGATGGALATESQRTPLEAHYQKRAEQMSDENLFKILMYKAEGRLTLELLDTESEEDSKWGSFVRKYTCDDHLATRVKDALTRSPIFLPRQISRWHNHQAQRDSSEGVEEETVGGKSVCRFNVNSYKMTFIMNSENCFYKNSCLARAQQSHRRVSLRLAGRFHAWHDSWLRQHVSQEQASHCDSWLIGQCADTTPTPRITIEANTHKAPYEPYNRYKGEKT